jgi:hypothetical protein
MKTGKGILILTKILLHHHHLEENHIVHHFQKTPKKL